MKHYYFIDNNVYFQNKKLQPRKVELFNVDVDFVNKKFSGYDKDGDFYLLNSEEHELLIEGE